MAGEMALSHILICPLLVRRLVFWRLPLLRWPLWLLFTSALAASAVSAEPWQPISEADRHEASAELFYVKRTAARPSDGKEVSAHLAFFTSRAFRLQVVDLGADPERSNVPIDEVLRAERSPAGVNGGFFHPDRRPSGLVISHGRRLNRFETAKLLSGVIYSDDKGIHLVRRARFQDHPGITALLQTGPYLVEAGRAVRGLSNTDSRRRTFIATDWRGHWVLGATSSRLTLAELAECLASPKALTAWRIDRAINLDGGSSTGFFFDRGSDAAPVVLRPGKPVRNLLGIIAR
jgi:hypothetical protein